MTDKRPQPKLLFQNKEIDKVIADNPAKVPIILSNPDSKLQMEETELLFPKNTKILALVNRIKTQLTKNPNQIIILFCKGKTMNMDKTISDLYDNMKDDDGVLRIQVRSQESFGGTQN